MVCVGHLPSPREIAKLTPPPTGSDDSFIGGSVQRLPGMATRNVPMAMASFAERFASHAAPTPSCPENRWLIADLAYARQHLYRAPRFHALEHVLLLLIAYPDPIALGTFVDGGEFSGSGVSYGEKTVAQDIMHYMSEREAWGKSRQEFVTMECVDTMRGDVMHVSPSILFLSMIQSEADWQGDSEEDGFEYAGEKYVMLDIPFHMHGSLCCNLQVPSSIRPLSLPIPVLGSGKAKVEQEIGWGSAVLPPGTVTQVHLDYRGVSRPIIGAGLTKQIWLTWPATPRNLRLWRNSLGRSSNLNSMMDAVRWMEKMTVWRQWGRDLAFILPTAHFYAVLTFGTSIHSSCAVCVGSDWEAAKQLMDWQLSLPLDTAVEKANAARALLEEMKLVLGVWTALAKKLTDKPDEALIGYLQGAKITADLPSIEEGLNSRLG